MTADGNPCRPERHPDRRGLLARTLQEAFYYERRKHRIFGTRGFTFLEILVAMVLMVFGVLGFSGLLKVIGDVEAEDTWQTKALFCAQERMEELKFDCVTGKGVTTDGEEIVTEGQYKGMRREWATGDSPLFEGLLEISAGCSYPWKGSMKTVQVSTRAFLEE